MSLAVTKTRLSLRVLVTSGQFVTPLSDLTQPVVNQTAANVIKIDLLENIRLRSSNNCNHKEDILSFQLLFS